VDDAFMAPPKPCATVAVTVMRFRPVGSVPSVVESAIAQTRL